MFKESKEKKALALRFQKRKTPHNCSVFPVSVYELDEVLFYISPNISLGTRNAVYLSKQGIFLLVSKKASLMLASGVLSNTSIAIAIFSNLCMNYAATLHSVLL